jgi:hypothetical protein
LWINPQEKRFTFRHSVTRQLYKVPALTMG